MRIGGIAVASAIALAVAAPAAARAPGQGIWTFGEVLTICISADGTWYNMNLPIAGHWKHIAPWTFFAGDLAPGGNLQGHIAARAHVGRRTIDVTDWGKDVSDDSEWFDVTLGMRFQRLSRSCELDSAGAAASGR
ncbi:MAG: hypothetical protein KJZ85_13160 [Rhodobacteraceae bacterium]|jgi:hypothetical protein|nr:hypothetical protein [Paracoccaceae bacterium]